MARFEKQQSALWQDRFAALLPVMLTLDLTADEPLLAGSLAPRPLLENRPGNQDAAAG